MDKPYKNDKEEAQYWKDQYFDLIFKRGSYVNWLKALNESLRLQLHNRSVEVVKFADGFEPVLDHHGAITGWIKKKKSGLSASKFAG